MRLKGTLAVGALALLTAIAAQQSPSAAAPKTGQKKTSRAKPAKKGAARKVAARKPAKLRPIPAHATRLIIEDIKKGTGPVATAGKMVTVHYRGTLTNGKKFDASYDRGEPFGFALGAGQVIQGWDKGVAGMRVGGKRRLIIPPDLGYGARGAGNDIPPNATLVFVVELLRVQ
jgi:peptidylprolyl isomerase